MSYLFSCVFVIHTQHFLLHFINFALPPQSAYVSFKLCFLLANYSPESCTKNYANT